MAELIIYLSDINEIRMSCMHRRWFNVIIRSKKSIGAADAISNIDAVMKLIDKAFAKGGNDLQSILQSVESVQTFRGIVQTYNDKKEFIKTTAVFKNGPRECRNDFESILAAMTAYTYLGTPASSKTLLMAMENKKMTSELQALSFEVMIIGYSRTDRLDFVEGSLYEWLIRSGETGSKLIETLVLKKNEKVSLDLERVFSLNDSLPLPGLKTWAAVAKLYTGRYACEQCLKVLDVGKSINIGSSSNTLDNDTILNKIYLYSIRALCDAGHFERAVEIIRELKSRNSGGEISDAYLLTHLLKYYRFRDGGFRVSNDQFDAILGRLKKKEDAHGSVGDRDSDDFGSRYGSSLGLSSVFVSLLCLRGQPEAAERLLRSEAVAKRVRPSSVVMVINSYVKQDSWQKAEELFWEFFDGNVLNEASARTAYHHVCEGMRDSNQLQSLLLFMEKFAVSASEPRDVTDER